MQFPVPLSGAPLASATTYQLHILLRRPQAITVGRLGRFSLEPGRYVYTGSARRNLRTRLLRHLSRHKSLHWHVDYLLACKYAEITAISLSSRDECVLNQTVNGDIPVRGFGASDCRAGCGAHLKYLGKL